MATHLKGRGAPAPKNQENRPDPIKDEEAGPQPERLDQPDELEEGLEQTGEGPPPEQADPQGEEIDLAALRREAGGGAADEEIPTDEELLRNCQILLDEIRRLRRLLNNDQSCAATSGMLQGLVDADSQFRQLEQSVEIAHQSFVIAQDELNNVGTVELDALRATFEYLRAIAERQQVIAGTKFTPPKPLGAAPTYLQLIGYADEQTATIAQLEALQAQLLALIEPEVAALSRQLGGDAENRDALVEGFLSGFDLIGESEREDLESQGEYFHPMRNINNLLIQILTSQNGDPPLSEQLKNLREDVLDLYRNAEHEHCLGPAPQNRDDFENANIPGLTSRDGPALDDLAASWREAGDAILKAIEDFKSGESRIISEEKINKTVTPEALAFQLTAYQPLDEEVDRVRQALGEAEISYFDEVSPGRTGDRLRNSFRDAIVGLLEVYKIPALLRDAINQELDKILEDDPALLEFVAENPSYQVALRAIIIRDFLAGVPDLLVNKLAELLEADAILDADRLAAAYDALDAAEISGVGTAIETREQAQQAVDALILGEDALSYTTRQIELVGKRQDFAAALIPELILTFTGSVAFRSFGKNLTDNVLNAVNVNVIGKSISTSNDLRAAISAVRSAGGGANTSTRLFALALDTPERLLNEFAAALTKSERRALGLPDNPTGADIAAVIRNNGIVPQPGDGATGKQSPA